MVSFGGGGLLRRGGGGLRFFGGGGLRRLGGGGRFFLAKRLISLADLSSADGSVIRSPTSSSLSSERVKMGSAVSPINAAFCTKR